VKGPDGQIISTETTTSTVKGDEAVQYRLRFALPQTFSQNFTNTTSSVWDLPLHSRTTSHFSSGGTENSGLSSLFHMEHRLMNNMPSTPTGDIANMSLHDQMEEAFAVEDDDLRINEGLADSGMMLRMNDKGRCIIASFLCARISW
jgi:hypothetical protein